MTKKANLLWIDLEMTGLDPEKDAILEVAVVATNYDLKEVASYEGVVRVPDAQLAERIHANKQFWDQNTKARDGLLEQNTHGKSSKSVEKSLIDFIEQHFDQTKPIYLAGNSVYMDHKFLAKNWPDLMCKLHYRILDVSSWKIIFENKMDKRFLKPEEHRALSDIRGSIEELKYYLRYVGKHNK